MLKIQIISQNNFLHEALSSYNFENFIIVSHYLDLEKHDIMIIDKGHEFVIAYSSFKESILKPIKLSKMVTMLLKIYSEFKINLSSITFMPSERIISNEHGEIKDLTQKEGLILSYLYLSNNLKLTQSELNKQVFGFNDEIDSNALESHIYRLRQKILSLTPESILESTSNGYSIIA